MAIEIIDGYCHCGVRKYRPIEDLRRAMRDAGVSRAVMVQHMGEYDHTYIEGIVQAEPERFAGAFLVDVDADDAIDVMTRWAERGALRGIRLLAGTLDTHPHVWERAVALGLNVIVFAQPTVAAYADALATFFQHHPEGRFILSHFGVLPLDERPAFPSFDRILALASCPNAFLQVSGMHAFSAYPYPDLVPLVEGAVEAFGPARMLYGSDFPAMADLDLYRRDLELLQAGKLGVPADLVPQVACDTARDLWFDPASRTQAAS